MNPFEEGSELENSTDRQLLQLFKLCDRKDKGFIVKEELEELCLSLGISRDDSDTLFCDLDIDKDNRISFEDFSSGFKEFLIPEQEETFIEMNFRRRASMWSISTELSQISEKFQGKGLGGEGGSEDDFIKQEELERKRKESVYHAWTTFTSSLLDSNLLSLSPESQAQIRQLYKELECKTVPQTVASKVDSTVSSLVRDMKHLQKQNKDLEKRYECEKRTHVKTLKSLEDDLEDQVSKVEERAKLKAKIENDEEKRKLREEMNQEIEEMRAQMKLFQKVDNWLKCDHEKNDTVHEFREKLEAANYRNRELQNALHETTTNLALLKTDLAHSRVLYEEKCKELFKEREQALEYMHQYDNLRRQLNLIHDANKRLQDTNDSLRENVEAEWKYENSLSRSSSLRSSLKRSMKERRSPSPVSLSHKDSGNRNLFGIGRFIDDLDSGNSTMPEKQEEEPLSDETMFINFSELDSVKDSLTVSLSSKEPNEHQQPSIDQNYFGSRQIKQTKPFQQFSSLQYQGVITPSPKSLDEQDFSQPLKTPDRTYKIVFAGDAAVGKTSFITRVCQGVFITNTASTLGVDYKVKSLVVDGKHIVIQLWDTAGQERFRSITKSYFRRADGVLLLYDVTCERSFTNLRHWVDSIDCACEYRIPFVICGNKTDLRDESKRKGFTIVSRDDGEYLAKQHKALFFETSTKTGENVLNATEELARQMSASEDIAVKTAALKVIASENKKKCCS